MEERHDAPAIPETVGQYVTRSVPRATPDAPADAIRRALAGRTFECATDVAVCEGDVLVGVIAIERILAAPATATARELMDADPPVVAPGTDQEVAAWKAIRHGESSLSVVGADGRFVGFLPDRKLLAVMLAEHHEDLARASGLLKGAIVAEASLGEPLGRRLAHRLPWLVVGLLGAVVAADLVAGFEAELRTRVALAFFLPGLVYMADAVGTQTETLVVRGLSVGFSMGRVIGREVLTGVTVGLGLALVALPVLWLRWGSDEVIVVVAVSLFGSCATATFVAVALPWAMQRMRVDPAFGSGPLATVVQDLLSIAIYFATARAMLG